MTHDDRLARVIERDFELLPDSRETHERWSALLVQHSIHLAQDRVLGN